MENQLLTKLAVQLNLTSSDDIPEPYILTPEDEKNIIANEIISLQKHKSWKMKGLGYTDAKIIEKIGEIDWHEELDKDEILKRYNSLKNYEVWEKQQREKEKKEEVDRIEEIKKVWTADHMFRYMQWVSQTQYGSKFIVNDDNKKLITALCFFLSNDPRFETQLGYDKSKGLLIRGVSGLGKTYLPKCLSNNGLNPISIVSMLEISDEVRDNGFFDLPIGSKLIYIDDVGSEEPVVKHYGTNINWFKQTIEMLYLRNQIFNRLMISTNISFKDIEDRYGFRVRSRMKDMFNIVDVTGLDMRGQK